MEVEASSARTKAEETLAKCNELFDSGKFYEYSQKVKLFSHRKLHSNKVEEALHILNLAARKLLAAGEEKEGQELLAEWQKDLEANKKEFSQEHFESLIEAYKAKETEWRGEMLEKFASTFKEQLDPNSKELVIETLVAEHIRKGSYGSAEKFVVYQDLARSTAFVKQWGSQVQPEEAQFIQMRFGLLKILHQKKDEGEALVFSLPKESPFRRFAELLIECFKQRSKQSYELMEKSYKDFIEGEPSIGKLYWALGFCYFRIEKENSGAGFMKIFG